MGNLLGVSKNKNRRADTKALTKVIENVLQRLKEMSFVDPNGENLLRLYRFLYLMNISLGHFSGKTGSLTVEKSTTRTEYVFARGDEVLVVASAPMKIEILTIKCQNNSPSTPESKQKRSRTQSLTLGSNDKNEYIVEYSESWIVLLSAEPTQIISDEAFSVRKNARYSIKVVK